MVQATPAGYVLQDKCHSLSAVHVAMNTTTGRSAMRSVLQVATAIAAAAGCVQPRGELLSGTPINVHSCYRATPAVHWDSGQNVGGDSSRWLMLSDRDYQHVFPDWYYGWGVGGDGGQWLLRWRAIGRDSISIQLRSGVGSELRLSSTPRRLVGKSINYGMSGHDGGARRVPGGWRPVRADRVDCERVPPTERDVR